MLLSKVTLIDANEIRKKAYLKSAKLLAHRDKKDIPFLAVHFHIRSHSILSDDRDFEEATHTKLWKYGELQQVILSKSITGLFEVFHKIISAFMRAVIEFVHWLYDKSMTIASSIARNLSNVAPHILLGLGSVLLL